jgi:dUTP pyrophosphatase
MTVAKFKRLNEWAKIPSRAYPTDAAFDLFSCRFHRCEPGTVTKIPTGIAMELLPFHAGHVLPRSGLAAKHQITLQNSPGLIDAGYRGEIVVLLRNEGEMVYNVTPGERIAQLEIVGLPHVEAVEVAELGPSERGANGLGSTGK